MNRNLTGFLNIIGILILLAWTPVASAASWSSTICNPPPTYGPYNLSGGSKYYCPAAGSFSGTTSLTGGITSVINTCADPAGCVFVTDKILLANDTNPAPNALIQCIVPGSDTCKNPGQCGSSSIRHVKQVFQAEIIDPVTSDECTRQGKNGPIKCQKTNRFAPFEGQQSPHCPNDNWVVQKWLALRLFIVNTVTQDSATDTTTMYCELLDPQGRRPGEDGYSPDLTTLSNNNYSCVDL